MKSTKTVQSYKNTAADKNRSSRVTERSGFADPIAIRTQNPKDEPKDGINSPWDFRCPQYDERSGNSINAGTHYGVGHRQPVGHEGNPRELAPTLPQRRMNTQQDDDLG